MSYPQHNWPPASPPPWPQDQNLEHRLTRVEVIQEGHEEAHEEHYSTTDRHRERLNQLERLILVMAGLLAVVLQDKFPQLAALLRGTP